VHDEIKKAMNNFLLFSVSQLMIDRFFPSWIVDHNKHY